MTDTEQVKSISKQITEFVDEWFDPIGPGQESYHQLHAFAGDIEAQVKQLTVIKDGAYRERDQLVAALSRLFPALLERHQPDPDPNWESDWMWIVFIDTPAGQCSWHIHDSELSLFDHLSRNLGCKWDGHSTEEKYERLTHIDDDPRTCPCCGDTR